ncbi:MAG: P-loop NTPase fold protein [bacterium]|nr:P-loop NTPase fold protein [bacterium]
MAGPPSTFGRHGYRNVVSVLGLTVPVALAAYVFVDGRPVGPTRDALVAALVPVGLIIVFRFGYAADLPRRVALFGPDREERPFRLVGLFFLVALATVSLTLAYLTLGEGEVVCLVRCDFDGILGVGKWPNPFRLGYTTSPRYLAAGVGAVLAGSVQMLYALVLPQPLDPEAPVRDVYRRVLWRVAGVAVFWGGGLLLAIPAGVALTNSGLSLVAALRVVSSLFFVGGLAFEFWHPGGRVVSAPKGGSALLWRVGLRALVMSFVFTPWVDLAVLSWTFTASYVSAVTVAQGCVGLAASGALVHSQGQGIPDVLLKTYVQGNQKTDTHVADTPLKGDRRVRPPPFDADDADPFAKDLLGRETQVRGLSDRIVTMAGPATVMVDGPWGSGKTVFLRMCAADLRNRGETVVEFDAWAAQHTQRPALDLLGALSLGLTDPAAGRLADARVRLATALQAAVPDPRYDSWKEQRRAADSIRESLESAAAERRRLVMVIDELDRCPPSYVLDALSDIHHLFAVEGVVVIVGVNRRELCEVVRSVYGPRFNADGYLRRLADVHIALPAITQTDTADFFANALQEAGLTQAADPRSLEILRLVIDVDTCALRDLQQAVHVYATAVAAPAPPELPSAVWEMSLAAMTVLRFADKDAFRSFAARTIDSFEALAKAYAAFGPEPTLIAERTVPFYGLRVDMFSAALLNMTHASPDWCTKPAGFHERYIPIHRPRPPHGHAEDASTAADRVLTFLCHTMRGQHDPVSPPTPEAAEVAAVLDLVYYPSPEA